MKCGFGSHTCAQDDVNGVADSVLCSIESSCYATIEPSFTMGFWLFFIRCMEWIHIFCPGAHSWWSVFCHIIHHHDICTYILFQVLGFGRITRYDPWCYLDVLSVYFATGPFLSLPLCVTRLWNHYSRQPNSWCLFS